MKYKIDSILKSIHRNLLIYSKPDYRLVQSLFLLFGIISFVGHMLFYIILKYHFGFWESFLLRIAAASLSMSLLFLPRNKQMNFIQIWYFELVFAFVLPFVFNIFLFKNSISTYWAASVVFAALPYGLFSHPIKALVLYPLSVWVGIIVLEYVSSTQLSVEEIKKVTQINFAAYFMVFFLGIVQTIIKQAYAIIDRERHRSEKLLHNILPVSIADQLKSNTSVIANRFESATVLFADIVGFTSLSEKMPPEKLTHILNLIFSMFDFLADKYGLEKIKTIGDAYMVAGGIPTQNKDHVEAVADMALEMLEELTRFNIENGQFFTIRIGIHSGPLVAGVIGTKKFTYDVWGDTVNTASRMESHGISGKIQVSQQVYEILKNKYKFEERGIINIKGKGEMKTYLLQGRMSRLKQ